MEDYESEITRFIREMKQRRPDLDRKQREAREIWWDKALDLEEQKRFEESTVKMPAYVYQPKPKLS
jgi:Protein of unknown function (DUF3460)